MKIAIVSRVDLEDRTYWSGTTESVYSKLKQSRKFKIIKIDKLNNTLRKIFAIKREYYKYIKKVKFDESYNEYVSKNFAYQIERKLKKYKNIDLLLTFDSSLIAHIKTGIPIVLWTDMLYSDYYKHYYNKKKISRDTIKSINSIEKKALNNCTKVLLASNWAVLKAKTKYYGLKNKFYLLHYGPNFKTDIKLNKIKRLINKRSRKSLDLITLSVDWKRKGLNNIIKLNNLINKKDIKSKLKIIGINKKNLNNKNIQTINFIDKNSREGENKISKHLLNSHFHILFSNAEAYGVSLIEANSRGVPNVSLKVGGISQIVKNRVNGMIFEKKLNLQLIADKIIKIFKDKKKYNELAKSSYNEYYKNFSYKKLIPNFIKIINQK